MLWYALLLILPLMGAILYLGKFASFPYVSFFLKGYESGFSLSEINLLRKTAVQVRLREPAALFWSEKALDRCIRGMVIRQIQGKGELSSDSAEFLGKLLDFRKRVEFNLPRHRMGLTSTRSILPGQVIKLALTGDGLFVSKVVENHRKYMVIQQPPNPRMDKNIPWHGARVKVYFWRQEDAGYYFESKVISPDKEGSMGYLHLLHSDGLIRTQKRSTIRVGLRQQGHIFPMDSLLLDETWRQDEGLLCRLVDISESGAGIAVKGRGKPGIILKLQTVLAGMDIVLCGTVKSVNYNDKQHASILHLEALPPSRVMKNRILTYVFGILRDTSEPAGSVGEGSENEPGAVVGNKSVPEELSKDDSIPEPNAVE